MMIYLSFVQQYQYRADRLARQIEDSVVDVGVGEHEGVNCFGGLFRLPHDGLLSIQCFLAAVGFKCLKQQLTAVSGSPSDYSIPCWVAVIIASKLCMA